MDGKIKAVFFDVDGTLISHKMGDVPQSTRKALKELQKRGIRVIVATGRHTLELRELPVKDIAFDGYVVINGQLCLDWEQNTIYDAPICPEGVRAMVEIFERKEIPVTVVEKDRIYVNFVNDLLKRRQKEIFSPVPDVGVYEGGNVYQYCVYATDEEIAQIAKKAVSCKVTKWNDAAYDIIAGEGGKRQGMEKLLERYGIKREETMAFGDGENDISMLAYAQVGVAMGNADDTVKACADYVTASVDEDGVAEALKYYGLI